MYISEIRLNNIRCFESFSLNLEDNGKPIKWIMIIGDNSVGKSCLLRSIALGLCDQASAAALMKEMPGDILRQNTPKKDGKYEGWIEINLKRLEDNRQAQKYTIKTTITKKRKKSPEIVTQDVNPEENFPWDDIFVCGYGPQRAIEGDQSYYKYSQLDAVYTLFNYESTLQNPELVLRRKSKKVRKELENNLLDILMLDKKKFRLIFSQRGMEIKGPDWEEVPVSLLSDGYRSTTNWVLDFFAWQIYSRKIQRETASKHFGMLLIDEIEQHLHPKWQRYIVSKLRKTMPSIQFITSSHAPLAVAGVSDIDNAILVYLKKDKNKHISKTVLKSNELKGMRADQILTSNVFGLPTARSGFISDKIELYRKLFLKDKLSDSDKKIINNLRNSLLKEFPGFGETEEDLKVQRDLRRELKEIKKILKEEN